MKDKAPESSSLYSRLLVSHLQIAGMAAALLCICLTMIVYFQHQSAQIADVRLPAAVASSRVVNGVDNSNAHLRSSVLLRNAMHKENRIRAWEDDIDPAMSKLETFTDDIDLTTIASLREKMSLLRDSQWWVADVAATVGNNPALLIYERDLLPNFVRIQSAVVGLEITGATSKHVSDIKVEVALTHQSLSEVIRQLSDAVRTGHIVELREFRSGSDVVTSMLEALSGQFSEQGDADQLLAWIMREYRTYEKLADQTIAIRQSNDWNIALHILSSETEPLINDVKESLLAIQTEHNILLHADVSRSALISKVGTFVTLAMIIVLGLIAWAVARENSARIVAPIKALANLSTKLAESEDRPVQLPVKGPREIAHLIEQFNYMARELTTRTKDLRHANKELQTYTHIITHDLKPPLINIKGHAGLIKDQLQILEQAARDQGKSDQAVRDTVLRIVSGDIPDSMDYIDLSISKMKTLVDGVFDNSTLLFRTVSLEIADLNSLVDQVIALFSHRAAGTVIKRNPLPQLRTDAFLMEHIFSNLIDNALKYLEQNRPGKIELGGEILDGEAHFYVRDNGIGMADSSVNIFELFKRADSEKSGNGIGLALVATMLSKLGGRIWHEPNYPYGAIFRFCVPASDELPQKRLNKSSS